LICVGPRVRSNLVPGSFKKSFVLGSIIYLQSLVFKRADAFLIVVSFEGYQVISFRVDEKFDRSIAGLENSTCEHVTETLDLDDS
jgi:hypothetical protein